MTRVRQPQRVTGVIAGNQPLESSQHVSAGGIEGSPAIARVISQDDHVALVGGVPASSDQVFAHVHGIIDAAVQLVFGTGVVDSDEESFSARHFGLYIQGLCMYGVKYGQI